MEIFFVWIVLSIVVAYVAAQKGRSAGGMFLLSLVLSPLIGILVVIALPARTPPEQTSIICWSCKQPRLNTGKRCRCGAEATPLISPVAAATKACPMCAEVIQAAAIKCRYCGSELTAAPPPIVSMTSRCAGCRQLRGTNITKCFHCGNTDPVILT